VAARADGRRGHRLLATGVVLGVSTLAAAVLKSAISPVGAMAAVFADRTPAALRNAVVHQFGRRAGPCCCSACTSPSPSSPS
jgi:hypothetical protein